MRSSTEISKESIFLPGEISTQSTKANSEDTIAPCGSMGISFGDLGPDRTQTTSGEGTERSDIQKLDVISSHVPTQPVATELINRSHLEGSKTASLTTEVTSATEGKSFIFVVVSVQEHLLPNQDLQVRKTKKLRINCNFALDAFSKTLSETGSLFSRFARNHYSGLPIKVVGSKRGCGK